MPCKTLLSLDWSDEVALGNWKIWSSWSLYGFRHNSGGRVAPRIGELNQIRQRYVATTNVHRSICYMISDQNASVNVASCSKLSEPLIILALSTTNSAHSVSELISFINFYSSNNLDINVGISSVVREKMPFVFQLFGLFVPPERIVVLDAGHKYYVEEAWFRRNTHINYLTTWNRIPFKREGNILEFSNLQETARDYCDDPELVMRKCNRIHAAFKERFSQHSHIMLAKLSTDGAMTTPGRAMELGSKARTAIEAAGIRLVAVRDFSSIEQYIATLYGAKTFITSYGGPACTNRFFLNPEADVLLLGNLAYRYEYAYPSDAGEYSHLRKSHLFPVRRQTVVLDHNDVIDDADVRRIVELSQPLSG